MASSRSSRIIYICALHGSLAWAYERSLVEVRMLSELRRSSKNLWEGLLDRWKELIANYGSMLALMVAGILILKYVGKDLAWPALLLLFVVVFRKSINTILSTVDRLASRAKAVTIQVAGETALTLDIDVMSGVLQDMVTSAVVDLTPEQKQLFLFICRDEVVKEKTLEDGPLKFKVIPRPRSNLHEDLRGLRDFNCYTGRRETKAVRRPSYRTHSVRQTCA